MQPARTLFLVRPSQQARPENSEEGSDGLRRARRMAQMSPHEPPEGLMQEADLGTQEHEMSLNEPVFSEISLIDGLLPCHGVLSPAAPSRAEPACVRIDA